jgi:hypothetical protein
LYKTRIKAGALLSSDSGKELKDLPLKELKDLPLKVDFEKSGQNQESSLVFPWRHDETPLGRLVPGTLEYAKQGHLLSTTGMKPGNPTINAIATGYMFLDVPWYQFPFFGSWKEELAESISWGFNQAVATMLSNLYHGACKHTQSLC